MLAIKKRNGVTMPFDKQRIIKAINKAFIEVDGELYESDTAEDIADEIKYIVKTTDRIISVEEIQDMVEDFLMRSERKDVAKAYIRYRYKREIIRQTNNAYDGILKLIELNNEELKDENSNKNAIIASTQRDYMAGEVSKDLSQRYFLPKSIVDAHNQGIIHFHDMDYFAQHIMNCADGNMWVKIKTKDEIRTIQLKDLGQEIGLEDNQIADLKDASYLILSRDGWTKLKAISKRKLRLGEKLYTIRTRTGIPLKVTEDHRLPIIRDGQEQVVSAKDIKIGDSLINIENLQLSSKELSENFLDLTKLNNNDLDLRITNLSCLKNYLKYKYGVVYTYYAKEHGFDPRSTSLKLKDFNILTQNYSLSYDVLSQLRIKSNGSKHDYPLHIPFTSDLAKLYGYIYADGGVYINPEQSLYQLGFYNTNEQIVDDFLDCYENVFGYRMNKTYPNKNSTSPCIRVMDGSKLVVAIFKNFAGAFKWNVANISIPDFIMNGSDKIKYAFLSACLDTDGCLGNSAICYNTCGDKYSDQLILLLQGLGYHPHKTIGSKAGSVYKVFNKTGIRNYDNYKISVNRNDEMAKLQSHLTGYKYNDEYAYKGLNKIFNEEKIFSITFEENFKNSVYDLETSSHWYILNNYVSHNCCLVNLEDMLQNGTVINKTLIEKPRSFSTACTIATQIMAIVASG